MKYIKTYEKFEKTDTHNIIYNNMGISFFEDEINLIKKIISFFEKNKLVEIDIMINGKEMRIVYDYDDDDVLHLKDKWIYKKINGKNVEIMVGIKRYKGISIHTKILKFLENMTPEEIETAQAKNIGKLYNL